MAGREIETRITALHSSPLTSRLRIVGDRDSCGRISQTELIAQSKIQFAEHDANGDGLLDSIEFQVKGPFLVADNDSDGKLSAVEFIRVCEGVFLGLDKNRDGELTTADTGGKNPSQNAKSPKVNGKFPIPAHLKNAMDTNKDESVTLDEFLSFRRSQFDHLDKN